MHTNTKDYTQKRENSYFHCGPLCWWRNTERRKMTIIIIIEAKYMYIS